MADFHDARTGATIFVTSKSSILLTILWLFALLSVVGVLALGGFTLYVLGWQPAYEPTMLEPLVGIGIISVIILLVIAILNVRVLGFLRTKTDMSVERAAVVTIRGETVELWKDRSVWLTTGMIISSLILVVSLASVILFASAEFSEFPPIFWMVVSFAMVLNILVLNFLRVKVMMDPEEITIQSLQGATVTLRKKRSVWLTLAMAVCVLAGIGLLGIAVLAFLVSSWPEDAIATYFGEELSIMLADSFQVFPIVITGLFLLAGVGAFVQVAIFNHVRDKVFMS